MSLKWSLMFFIASEVNVREVFLTSTAVRLPAITSDPDDHSPSAGCSPGWVVLPIDCGGVVERR